MVARWALRGGGAPVSARVAAVDCGTNSLRLLIADVADVADGRPGDELRELTRRMEIVRLGQGVDRTGRLDPAALERTATVLRDYAGLIRDFRVERVRMVATSATRDATNRDTFVTMVREVLGVAPEVISGDEEAKLSFRGATAALAEVSEPLLVADIGGGSTELVLGGRSGNGTLAPTAAVSLDVGCVRLTERYLAADPPTAAQLDEAAAEVGRAMDGARGHVPLAAAATVIGLAGTVTTVAAAVLELDRYDPLRIHGARLPVAAVQAACHRLTHATRAEREALPYLHPGRLDVIAGGAVVLGELLRRCTVETLRVSESDILDGIALSAGAG